MTMFKLGDLFFRKMSLIDQQIEVYSMWTLRHHGWCLDSDQGWLRLFVASENLTDIEDATEESFSHFLKIVEQNYPSEWAQKDARLAVLRFMRFYKARTRSFTKNPRRVVSESYPQIL